MKINEKNLAAFATSGNQIDKEGQLMKKGDGNKGFAKRWFVLKGNLLFYFEKKTDREPIGVIILEGSTIELAESEMDEHYCFKVVFPSRSYVMSAESHQVMEQWMKALACASYDYVKLMAAELQRQLNEMASTTTPIPPGGRKFHSNKSEGASGNVFQNSLPHFSNSKPTQHVPTPPPRSRSGRLHREKPSVVERKTFESLHTEFGAKILKDQEKRWANHGHGGGSVVASQGQLSVLRQNTLIQL